MVENGFPFKRFVLRGLGAKTPNNIFLKYQYGCRFLKILGTESNNELKRGLALKGSNLGFGFRDPKLVSFPKIVIWVSILSEIDGTELNIGCKTGVNVRGCIRRQI